MNRQTKKYQVLFISNDASLTGAPIMLLHLLKFIRENKLWEINILLHRGGPMEAHFKEMGKTLILKPASYTGEKNLLKKGLMKLGMILKKWRLIIYASHYDFVFNNTIANGNMAQIFANKNIPVITFVHELEKVIAVFKKNGESQKTFLYSSFFLSPSNIVKQNLLQNHQIPQVKILPLNYYFPGYDQEMALAEKTKFAKQFLFENNIPEDKFLFFAMGTADLRKGFDYFVEICNEVTRKESDIHFVWIGDFTDPLFENEMKNKIREKKLEQYLTRMGNIPFNRYNLLPANLFLLTSREDPYPLVVLDAAFLQIPTIAFEDAGGATEFMEHGAGWLIKDFSLNDFAKKIIHLKNHINEIEIAGKNALEKAKSLHCNPLHTLTQLKAIESKIQIHE
ncbi:MAG: glycosyltransferase [Bacteroidetes bacterium]|nr:glycosyltransferase [Bacteroidota bacterium]